MQTVQTDKQALNAIATNLRVLRGGRSYGDLARACSTPDERAYPATIERIEKGRHMPGAGLLKRIAEALGVSVDRMLQEIPQKHKMTA